MLANSMGTKIYAGHLPSDALAGDSWVVSYIFMSAAADIDARRVVSLNCSREHAHAKLDRD